MVVYFSMKLAAMGPTLIIEMLAFTILEYLKSIKTMILI
jgi:hypothetical protein